MVKEPSSDATKPNKRPPNAFFIFATDRRKEIQKEKLTKVGKFGRITELKAADISKMLGKEWKAMSEAEKSPFAKEAKRLKEIYDKTAKN